MTVEDIEKAVSGLRPDELVEFRIWFERFDADCFDRKIERDPKGGKFDGLADDAPVEFAPAVPESYKALRKSRVLTGLRTAPRKCP